MRSFTAYMSTWEKRSLTPNHSPWSPMPTLSRSHQKSPVNELPTQDTSEGTFPPLVSVIIPCYRQAAFLSAGKIDSVLNQSYPAIEVIVINDGSDDDTDKVAGRVWKPDTLHLLQRNQGQAAARNTAIAAATGRYCLPLDSTTSCTPTRLVGWSRSRATGTSVLCVMGVQYFEQEGIACRERMPPRSNHLSAAPFLPTTLQGPHAHLFALG